jgi:hypothetical protein
LAASYYHYHKPRGLLIFTGDGALTIIVEDETDARLKVVKVWLIGCLIVALDLFCDFLERVVGIG